MVFYFVSSLKLVIHHNLLLACLQDFPHWLIAHHKETFYPLRDTNKSASLQMMFITYTELCHCQHCLHCLYEQQN